MEAKKAVKSFQPRKVEEHTIVDSSGKIVGHVRVKPSTIMWSPSKGKGWFGVSLAAFAAFMEKDGRKQSK